VFGKPELAAETERRQEAEHPSPSGVVVLSREEEKRAATQKATQAAQAKAERVLKATEAIVAELGAACDAAGIQRPVRKVRKYASARTFREVLADMRSDLPPAA